jgi:hypothetical protein
MSKPPSAGRAWRDDPRSIRRARLASVAVVSAVAMGGCGDGQDAPGPTPSEPPTSADPVRVIERAAGRTVDAGPSRARLTVASDGRRYAIDETLDPQADWYLTDPGGGENGVMLPPDIAILGPLFSFGASDTDRAYIGPIGADKRACWVEAHSPAGEVRGAVSAEEALVTTHTLLALLTRNVTAATEVQTAGNGGPGVAPSTRRSFEVKVDPPDFHDAADLAIPPTVSVSAGYVRERVRSGRAIVRGVDGLIVVTVDGDGRLARLALQLRGGPSPLSFTNPRPASSVALTFTGIGEGEGVRAPRCRGME